MPANRGTFFAEYFVYTKRITTYLMLEQLLSLNLFERWARSWYQYQILAYTAASPLTKALWINPKSSYHTMRHNYTQKAKASLDPVLTSYFSHMFLKPEVS